MKHLLLGAARSGKSRHAEKLAEESGKPVIYIATAEVRDTEMAARIAEHRARRPREWRLVEEPRALAETLRAQDAPGHCLLVDCLTLWLSNILELEERQGQHELDALLLTIPQLAAEVILVSNEVGWGIVPGHPLARQFRDAAGRLHQDLAVHCDRVSLLVAGIPLKVK